MNKNNSVQVKTLQLNVIQNIQGGNAVQKTRYFPRVSDQQHSKVTPLNDTENLALLMNILILSECCLLIHEGVLELKIKIYKTITFLVTVSSWKQ